MLLLANNIKRAANNLFQQLINDFYRTITVLYNLKLS